MSTQIAFLTGGEFDVRMQFQDGQSMGFVDFTLEEAESLAASLLERIRLVRASRSESSSSHVDSAPCDEVTPSALSRDVATAEGVSKLPAPPPGECG